LEGANENVINGHLIKKGTNERAIFPHHSMQKTKNNAIYLHHISVITFEMFNKPIISMRGKTKMH